MTDKELAEEYRKRLKQRLIDEDDSNGNVIYCKELLYGYEYLKEYDSNGNLIHRKFSNGDEYYFN